MNRLWVRLALSFMLVTGLVIVFVAGFMMYAVETNFGNFLNASNSLRFGPNFLGDLESYYAQHDSWEGVGELFPGQQTPGGGNRQGAGQGGGQGAQMFVAEPDGTIVYASNDEWIGKSMDDIGASRAVNLSSDGQVIGLLGEQTPGTIALNQAESEFLQDTITGLAMTALVGGVLALAVAIILARSLARPIRNLAASVGQMSASDLGQTVQTDGTLEIQQLATAFNDLSLRLADEDTRRQRMTADIAHELRTPVTVLRGHLEAMMDGIYPADVEHIAVAYDQTLHLARLVEDMRLLMQAEAGQISLDKSVIAPDELLALAGQRFQPLADDTGVHLKIENAPDLPDLEIDVNRTQQILDNLITNALRHTSEGGDITLSTRQAEKNQVTIRVQNTGEPISPEHVRHVFDRFWRADNARERDVGGTGLGLAITKLLVELQDGRIVAIPLEDGTAFEFSLPVHITGAPTI